MKLCEYGTHKYDGVSHSLFCNLIKNNCCFIRYCVEQQCIKMTSSYINCIQKRAGDDGPQKEISN